MSEQYHIGIDLGSGPDRSVVETWDKACDCQGTSSGPRIATEFEPFVPGESLKFRFVWCRIACDVCDKPWARTEIDNADGRE